MPQIISVQSLRHGTGTSTLTANVAVCLAQNGFKVGILETGSYDSGAHTLFGLDEDRCDSLLNYRLWTDTPESATVDEPDAQVAIPMGDGEIILMGRHIYLAPAQLTVSQINESLKQGNDPLSMTQGLSEIIRKLKLDYLLIDSHPELDEETMLMITISDVLLLVVSLENYILQETAVTVDVARSLGTPHILLLANQVLSSFDLDEVRQKLQETYGEPVLDVVPFVEELMALASRELFCQRFPDHVLTRRFRAIAQELITLSNRHDDETSPSITNTGLRVEAVNRYQQSPMLDLMTCPELYRRIVYYLMAHGASTAAEIATHLKTDDATIQPILGTLTEQGLVSKEVHQDDIRYQARL